MRTLIFAMVVFSLSACGAKRIELNPSQNQVQKQGVVSMYAVWVQDEGSKYDIQLHISNDTDAKAIVLLSDIWCFKGDVRGEFKHTFFNTGEKTMDFDAGEHKSFNLVCRHSTNIQGDYKIVLRKVYDNPQNDGKVTGKVIAENIEWKYPASSK